MKKDLHAIEFDGTTFGMPVETKTSAYEKFKKSVKKETAISWFGDSFQLLTVSHTALAAIMGGAQWLVSEGKFFDKFYIDGFKGNEEIFVKYSDDPIDFRTRRWEGEVHD